MSIPLCAIDIQMWEICKTEKVGQRGNLKNIIQQTESAVGTMKDTRALIVELPSPGYLHGVKDKL
jgi:hypothetical protein